MKESRLLKIISIDHFDKLFLFDIENDCKTNILIERNDLMMLNNEDESIFANNIDQVENQVEKNISHGNYI
jgi:hypothetical protein